MATAAAIRAYGSAIGPEGPETRILRTRATFLLATADATLDLLDITSLAKSNGVALGPAREIISQESADRIVAGYLNLSSGDRVIKAERFLLTDADVPIEWRILFFAP